MEINFPPIDRFQLVALWTVLLLPRLVDTVLTSFFAVPISSAPLRTVTSILLTHFLCFRRALTRSGPSSFHARFDWAGPTQTDLEANLPELVCSRKTSLPYLLYLIFRQLRTDIDPNSRKGIQL